MGKVDRIYENSVFSSTSFTLKDLTILDSGATIHVFNDLSRFYNFRKAPRGDYLITGDSHVPILGYGDVALRLKNGRILRLKDVAYCTNFAANLVSFSRLMDKGIHWNTVGGFLFRESDSSKIATIKLIARQPVIEEAEDNHPMALAVKKQRKQRLTSRDPRPASIGDGLLWHARMGHPGPMSLHMLGKNSLGVRLRGLKTVQCPHCSLAKIKRQISQRPPD